MTHDRHADADPAQPALARPLAHPDHQPLVLLQDDDTWKPACICGWQWSNTYDLRGEAQAIAYAFHDRLVA